MKVMINHLTGSKSGIKESFNRESVIIGRGNCNDVSLDPFLDPTVSSQHAEIRFEDNAFVLYDMGSLNGTYLNGSGVRRATLQDGDEISLGQEGPKLVFRFSEANIPAPSGGLARALKQMSSRRGPSTSMETEIPLLNERIVSPNFLVYVAAILLLVLVALLTWKIIY